MNGIKNLISKGETHTIEFKESLKLMDDIGNAVSAFSNNKAGKILVGVSDSRELIGVSIGKRTTEELANYIKIHIIYLNDAVNLR